MAVAQVAGGTATITTVGTEQVLGTHAGGKTVQLVLDPVNLAAGELLEVHLYSKALTGSAFKRIKGPRVIVGPAPGTLFVSFPVPSAHGVQAGIRQVGGTARTFDWSLQTLD